MIQNIYKYFLGFTFFLLLARYFCRNFGWSEPHFFLKRYTYRKCGSYYILTIIITIISLFLLLLP